jgi:hypothetical protein
LIPVEEIMSVKFDPTTTSGVGGGGANGCATTGTGVGGAVFGIMSFRRSAALPLAPPLPPLGPGWLK